jgi:hypothetical protein
MKRYKVSNINPSTYPDEIRQLVSAFLGTPDNFLYVSPKSSMPFCIVASEQLETEEEGVETEKRLHDTIDGMLFGGYTLDLEEISTSIDSSTQKKRPKANKKKKKKTTEQKLKS